MKALVILLLLVPSLALAQAPNGTDNAPFRIRHSQGRHVIQGSFDCDGTSDTLLANATFRGCNTLSFRKDSADNNRVYICPDLTPCAANTAGIYLEEGEALEASWMLNIAGNITCITSSGTITVFYFGECGVAP